MIMYKWLEVRRLDLKGRILYSFNIEGIPNVFRILNWVNEIFISLVTKIHKPTFSHKFFLFVLYSFVMEHGKLKYIIFIKTCSESYQSEEQTL